MKKEKQSRSISQKNPDLPLVSVGIPVYNEEKYINETLKSLAALNYPNIEYIISDNASTDRTFEICEEHAKTDSRFRLLKAEKNKGAFWNFKHVLDLTGGTYFMWAGGHDKWHVNYIQACVKALESDRQIVLVYTRTMFFGEYGEKVSNDDYNSIHLGPYLAFRKLIWTINTCNMFHGVFRRDILIDLICFQHPVVSSDFVLLAEVALRGKIIQLPAIMFYRRRPRAPETPLQQYSRAGYTTGIVQDNVQISEDFIIKQVKQIRNLLLVIVKRSKLSWFDKILAFLTVLTAMATTHRLESGHIRSFLKRVAWYAYRTSITESKYWDEHNSS